MIIKVKVHPNSPEQRVERVSEFYYNVYLKKKAEDNKANIALIKLLSREFGVLQKKIKIKVLTSREKVIKIIEKIKKRKYYLDI